jgi:regulatory protein
LRGLGFSHDAVEAALAEAVRLKLLDDRLYARLWVEDRLLHHPLAREAVRRGLAEKGIASEVIEEALAESYPPAKEKALALSLGQERFEHHRGLDREARARRTVSYLTRRGFPVALSSGIVRSLEKGREPDGDERRR